MAGDCSVYPDYYRRSIRGTHPILKSEHTGEKGCLRKAVRKITAQTILYGTMYGQP